MKFKKSGMLALLLTLVLSLITAGCSKTAEPKQDTAQAGNAVSTEISVGLIPAEAKVSDQAMEKFRTYLEQQTGAKIKMGTYPDYNGVVEAMNTGKLDMAFLGPLTYVIANHKGGARAIVAKTAKGVPYYYSYILERPEKCRLRIWRHQLNLRFLGAGRRVEETRCVPFQRRLRFQERRLHRCS
jgi:phosphonate transport system substrate-binding protein